MKKYLVVLSLIVGLFGVSCGALGLGGGGGDDAEPASVEGESSQEEQALPELAPTLGLDVTLTPDPDAPRDQPDGIPPTFTPEVQDLVSGVPTPEGQIEAEFDEEGNLVSEGELHTVLEGETLALTDWCLT